MPKDENHDYENSIINGSGTLCYRVSKSDSLEIDEGSQLAKITSTLCVYVCVCIPQSLLVSPQCPHEFFHWKIWMKALANKAAFYVEGQMKDT